MNRKKAPVQDKKTTRMPAAGNGQKERVFLWLVFFANSLILYPFCLDRYLTPRFFFLSVVLLVFAWMMRREILQKFDWRLHGFDLLLIGWYGFNLASVFWAFSWSEGVFYTQKVLLLLVVYWLVRQMLQQDVALVRKTLAQATTVLSLAVIAILTVQLVLGFSQNGLDNEKLYDAATGVFGNKSLASDFLFFLLIFNLLFYKDQGTPRASGGVIFFLSLLIIVLQTRAVFLACGISLLFYFPIRAWVEPPYRAFFFRRILPAGLLSAVLLTGLVALTGKGISLAERLNPATYMESMSANERRFVWYKTDELNKDHFWWGVGNGSWKIYLPSKNIEGGYRQQEQNIVFTRAHNDYLEMRAEMGIIGGLWFIGLFLAAAFAGLFSIRKLEDPRDRHDLLIVLTGLLGYCVIQYFDFPRERIELQVVLALLFAWATYLSRDLWNRLSGISIKRWSGLAGGLAIAGLIFNLFIGWYRMVGEFHNLNILKAQSTHNYRNMVQEAKSARNLFYEYDDVVLPMEYHAGIGYFYLDQTENAIDAFSEAYRLNPWAFPVINNYASALAKGRKYTEAIPLLEKSVGINPRFDEGKLNLAYSWYQLGDYDKSLQWLNRIDTIRNPQNDMDRQKNRVTKARQDEFMKMLEEKRK